MVEFHARSRSVPKPGGAPVPPKLTSILPVLREHTGTSPARPAAPQPPRRRKKLSVLLNTISLLILVGIAAIVWLKKPGKLVAKAPPPVPVAAAPAPTPVQPLETTAPPEPAPTPPPKTTLVVEGRTPGKQPLDGWVQVFKTDRPAADIIRAAEESEPVKDALDAIRVSERAVALIGKSATLEQNRRLHLAALGDALRTELIGAELVGDGVLEDGEAVLAELPPSPPEGYLVYGFGTADGNIAGLFGNAVIREGESAKARPDELVYAAVEEDWTGARWKPIGRD